MPWVLPRLVLTLRGNPQAIVNNSRDFLKKWLSDMEGTLLWRRTHSLFRSLQLPTRPEIIQGCDKDFISARSQYLINFATAWLSVKIIRIIVNHHYWGLGASVSEVQRCSHVVSGERSRCVMCTPDHSFFSMFIRNMDRWEKCLWGFLARNASLCFSCRCAFIV